MRKLDIIPKILLNLLHFKVQTITNEECQASHERVTRDSICTRNFPGEGYADIYTYILKTLI